uniref:ATP-grasp domain-containing protein n=1 Tax=Noctiluca scintillans TaxID=2966 RepID=A0A7S0ZP31_NOCSC
MNLVSDTAAPHLQRRLIAAMRAAEAAGVPVINGVSAHAACAAKVAQHALLLLARLPAPATIVVPTGSGAVLAAAVKAAELRYPLLLKPNAGGFGQGIARFSSETALQNEKDGSDRFSAFGDDGLALLQEQMTARLGEVGRIWVLGGTILCAVRAPAMRVDDTGPESASGCMANSQSAVAARAWAPPPSICQEVLRLAELAGATWGSVELMWPESHEENKYVYFDLNLSCVSSLPDPALVADPDNVWAPGFEPYREMARYVSETMAKP